MLQDYKNIICWMLLFPTIYELSPIEEVSMLLAGCYRLLHFSTNHH